MNEALINNESSVAPKNGAALDYDARLARSADWPVFAPGIGGPVRRFLLSNQCRYGLLGFAVFFGLWYFFTAIIIPPRFNFIPNPLSLFGEWISERPKFGVSIFTPEYYQHIWVSTARVYGAFALSVLLGAPLGILLGWNRTARNLVYPIVELLRRNPEADVDVIRATCRKYRLRGLGQVLKDLRRG